MNLKKITHWLITLIGFLTLGLSVYQFIIDTPFKIYFFGGLSGLVLIVLGISFLLKKEI